MAAQGFIDVPLDRAEHRSGQADQSALFDDLAPQDVPDATPRVLVQSAADAQDRTQADFGSSGVEKDGDVDRNDLGTGDDSVKMQDQARAVGAFLFPDHPALKQHGAVGQVDAGRFSRRGIQSRKSSEREIPAATLKQRSGKRASDYEHEYPPWDRQGGTHDDPGDDGEKDPGRQGDNVPSRG